MPKSCKPILFTSCVELCTFPVCDDSLTTGFLKPCIPHSIKDLHIDDIVCFVFRTLNPRGVGVTYHAIYSCSNTFPTHEMMRDFFPHCCPYLCYATRLRL